MLLAFIILYILITIAVGLWASRKVSSSSDYMLAGRSLPIALSTAALFATWFGSETVFGASSQFLEGGLYAVIEDPFGAALCLLLFGFFYARKLYNLNLMTLVDFFKDRFGKRTEFLASVLLIPSYFGYAAAQLVALGLILNVVTGLPVWQGIIASAMVVTLYTFIGGMWAISITDFFQGIMIVVGLLILAFVLADEAGGAATVLKEVPASNFKFFPERNWVSIVEYLAAWSVLGLGSIPSQDVFQRVMSSASAKVAVRSCFYSAFLYLTIAMLPLFIGLCIKHLYADQLVGDQQLALPNMVLAHTALPVQILFFGSLLSAVMSTTSSSLLAPSSIFSENIVKPFMKGKLSDKQLLLTTRISVAVFGLIAIVLACLNTNIYELVGASSVFSLVSLFIPLTFGLYWKPSNSYGAICSMVFGMITWFIFLYFPISIPSLVPAVGASLFGMVAGSLIKKEQHDKN